MIFACFLKQKLSAAFVSTPADVVEVSHPVVLDGVHHFITDSGLTNLNAGALMDSKRQSVGNPEVLTLM